MLLFFKKKLEILLNFQSFLQCKVFKKRKIAQIYYYGPQSSGINVQSPPSESTPRRLTLLTHLSLGKSIQTLRELVFCNYISFCEHLCSLQNQYQISHQYSNVRNIFKQCVIKVNYFFSIGKLLGVFHFVLDD